MPKDQGDSREDSMRKIGCIALTHHHDETEFGDMAYATLSWVASRMRFEDKRIKELEAGEENLREQLATMCEQVGFDLSGVHPITSDLINFIRGNIILNQEVVREGIAALEAQLKSAREVIGFYGDKENWPHSDSWEHYIIDDSDREFNLKEHIAAFGGKRARQWLKENG